MARKNGTYLTAVIRPRGKATIRYSRPWWGPTYYKTMRRGWDYSIRSRQHGVWHKVITCSLVDHGGVLCQNLDTHTFTLGRGVQRTF